MLAKPLMADLCSWFVPFAWTVTAFPSSFMRSEFRNQIGAVDPFEGSLLGGAKGSYSMVGGKIGNSPHSRRSSEIEGRYRAETVAWHYVSTSDNPSLVKIQLSRESRYHLRTSAEASNCPRCHVLRCTRSMLGRLENGVSRPTTGQLEQITSVWVSLIARIQLMEAGSARA